MLVLKGTKIVTSPAPLSRRSYVTAIPPGLSTVALTVALMTGKEPFMTSAYVISALMSSDWFRTESLVYDLTDITLPSCPSLLGRE